MKRLDHFLVEKEMAPSRSQAQQFIKEGLVLVNQEIILKAGHKVKNDDEVLLKKENVWVGRGAEKLIGAHQDFDFDFKDKVVADLGASTGGFTEYALFQGAKKVYAVDVGHDQLALKLREDSRVVNLEGVNIKDGLFFEEACDLVIVDLSFISLKLVFDSILSCLCEGGEYVILVKPQFEVGRTGLGKKGLVKNKEEAERVLVDLKEELTKRNAPVLKVTPSRVLGNKSGNQEYFFYGKFMGKREG